MPETELPLPARPYCMTSKHEQHARVMWQIGIVSTDQLFGASGRSIKSEHSRECNAYTAFFLLRDLDILQGLMGMIKGLEGRRVLAAGCSMHSMKRCARLFHLCI